ncbi:PepSY-associated TM helix domain-containing protein [Paracraurococcus lichenis]|uniref:PepSY-associated TM helix domain-containing protein n=1 Tax=Paracraurococcus lichenis TaxID=3064888 RepID=A0ABT9E6F7_9PROT|nr:PepSY-associated TM helix domain-containing protein [Paracraurococcus sp. LOR1-02]MDO9711704.1 PepSY-associated TM helix domain-containing protein [Paracraurococcus sp. LOR1-02]
MTARRALLLGHRWIGLVLGLVLALLGASGSILSFQREIDAALHPALFTASGPASPEIGYAAIMRAAEAAGRPVGGIRPPDAVWPVWIVSPPRGARGGLTGTYDPATGALLGEWDTRAGFVGTVRQFHEVLLLREQGGREIVGWLGVLTLLFCGTGLWLWWPRQGGLGRALVTLRRRPALLLNLDLHRLVGVWTVLVLAVVAFSGVAIVFPGWFRPLLGIAAPGPGFGPAAGPAPERAGSRPAGGQERPRAPAGPDADAIVAAALAHLPGQEVTGLSPPARPGQGWTVTLRPAGTDPEVRARTLLSLDAASGAVLQERGPRTRGPAEEALALQRWLHGGALLGWPGRILVFLSGLAMPLFFVTGLAAWLLRRRNRRRLALLQGKPA